VVPHGQTDRQTHRQTDILITRLRNRSHVRNYWQYHTSDDKVVALFLCLSVHLAATDVPSGAQLLQSEVGNRQREIVEADTKVLPVGVAVVHSRAAGEDRLRLVIKIKDLDTVVKH